MEAMNRLGVVESMIAAGFILGVWLMPFLWTYNLGCWLVAVGMYVLKYFHTRIGLSLAGEGVFLISMALGKALVANSLLVAFA